MNKTLIVDASDADGRIMSGLLIRAGYNPLVVGSIEAGKLEAAKLPPGAVIVTAMRLPDGTAKEFANWLKTEVYKFLVIAIVDNLANMDAIFSPLRNNQCCCTSLKRNIPMFVSSALRNRN